MNHRRHFIKSVAALSLGSLASPSRAAGLPVVAGSGIYEASSESAVVGADIVPGASPTTAFILYSTDRADLLAGVMRPPGTQFPLAFGPDAWTPPNNVVSGPPVVVPPGAAARMASVIGYLKPGATYYYAVCAWSAEGVATPLEGSFVAAGASLPVLLQMSGEAKMQQSGMIEYWWGELALSYAVAELHSTCAFYYSKDPALSSSAMVFAQIMTPNGTVVTGGASPNRANAAGLLFARAKTPLNLEKNTTYYYQAELRNRYSQSPLAPVLSPVQSFRTA